MQASGFNPRISEVQTQSFKSDPFCGINVTYGLKFVCKIFFVIEIFTKKLFGKTKLGWKIVMEVGLNRCCIRYDRG
jgi:hypothetical protein